MSGSPTWARVARALDDAWKPWLRWAAAGIVVVIVGIVAWQIIGAGDGISGEAARYCAYVSRDEPARERCQRDVSRDDIVARYRRASDDAAAFALFVHNRCLAGSGPLCAAARDDGSYALYHDTRDEPPDDLAP